MKRTGRLYGVVSFGLALLAVVSIRPGRVSAANQQNQVASLAAAPPPDRAVLDKYCVTCHNEKLRTAGLLLDKLELSKPDQNGEILERVIRKLRTREMPPAGRPRPDAATYDGLISSLENALDAVARAHPNPGRPALHRLNRTEYANVIRDLLALEIDAAALLPDDDSTYGFDNIADVLGVSPELLESYVVAGQKISRLAIGDPDVGAISETYTAAADQTQDYHLPGFPLGSRGGLRVHHTFPVNGEYEIRVRLMRNQLRQVRGLQEPHDLEVSVDGASVKVFRLDGGPHLYEEKIYDGPTPSLTADEGLRVRLAVEAGPHEIIATFPVEPAWVSENMSKLVSVKSYVGDMNAVRGLPHVENITVTGPFGVTGPGDTPSRRRIFTCRPARPADEFPCAKQIVSTLARRAYRGTATEADVQLLLDFYNEGRKTGTFDIRIERALWRMLAAPRFVFRYESDPPGAPAVHRVTDLELASRLSFFLWSSIPDDQLLNLAARGELTQPAVLEREVRRMLADPRAHAVIDNFAGQWLNLRRLATLKPSVGQFPDFDDNLRQAFRRETEMLFEYIIREDRSVLDLLNADYTFVDERLARHYGIPNVYGSRFRKVAVLERRRGLLGHGSILAVTSYPTRTSPVLRGKWVLSNLIGSPPPPPPPNVPTLDESGRDATGKVLTMRERMAAHRANPICANCHARMDPIGFALEPFDAIGRWRDDVVDVSGTMPDGTKFDGPAGLREALLSRPEIFVGTMTEKLLTYALGRGLEYYDAPAVRATVREAARTNYAFSSIIMGIVKSVPFQMRTAAETRPPAATSGAR